LGTPSWLPYQRCFIPQLLRPSSLHLHLRIPSTSSPIYILSFTSHQPPSSHSSILLFASLTSIPSFSFSSQIPPLQPRQHALQRIRSRWYPLLPPNHIFWRRTPDSRRRVWLPRVWSLGLWNRLEERTLDASHEERWGVEVRGGKGSNGDGVRHYVCGEADLLLFVVEDVRVYCTACS
jgi:hypothetical protein